MSKKETQFNFDGIEEIASETSTVDNQEESTDILSDQQMEEVAEEVELEQKYGDSTLRTFAERAASSASFGLSDQALIESARLLYGDAEAAKVQEGLREREARNEASAMAGEVTGVVAPALISGGTSLIAKGATAGVRGAAKAGLAAEKVAAKQLAKVLGSTSKNKIAKDVIVKSMSKAAGSAVEAGAYGFGHLVKEEALGKADFNAENLISSIGTAAIIGGAAGGVLGSTEALVPVIKNNKVVDVVKRKINNTLDKNKAAFNLQGKTAAYAEKFKSKSDWHAKIHDNMSNFFKDRLKLQKFDSIEKLANGAEVQIKKISNEIGGIVKKLDDSIKVAGVKPSRSKVANRIINNLEEMKSKVVSSPGTDAILDAYDDEIAKWYKWNLDGTEINAKDLQLLKKNLQDVANYKRASDSLSDQERIRRAVARSVRDEFMDLADRASSIGSPFGEHLRKANLDYATALEVSKNLSSEAAKLSSSNFLKFRDVFMADILIDVAGGGFGLATTALAGKKLIESKLAQKVTILSNIERANQKINSKIGKSLSNFITGTKKVAVPASTKILLNTSFNLPDSESKKPKNKKEAFKQLSEDLVRLQSDPQKLIEHLSRNNLATTDAAPNTASAMNITLAKAVQFLNQKMPKDPSPGSQLFAREWEPSSIELAKFERYLQAVENPMTVLDDLESGSITREGVEALQAVYPDIYQRVVDQAIEQIAENPQISYDKRIQMGLLLNLPSDTSLMPENITALQQQFTDLEQQQNAARKDDSAVEPTQTGMSKLSMAEDAQTDTQRTATRKQE